MYRRLSTLVLTSIVAGAVIGVLGKFALPPLGFGAIMLPTAVGAMIGVIAVLASRYVRTRGAGRKRGWRDIPQTSSPFFVRQLCEHPFWRSFAFRFMHPF